MTQLIPREILFGNPERTAATLSPDGSRIAHLAPLGGVLNVFVGAADGDDFKPVTADTDRGVRTYFWSADSAYVPYLQDAGGDENWRLHRVDPTTGEDVDVTPFDGVQARLVARSKRRPDVVLVGLNHRDPRRHDVYRLRVASGDLELIEENTDFAGYLADDDLQVRAASRQTEDAGTELLYRETPDDEWRVLRSVEFGETLSPVAFTADGTALYFKTSAGANTSRLLRLDLATDRETVVAEDPQYDVTGVMLDPDTKQAQAVTFLKDRAVRVVLDDSVRDDLAAVDAISPGDTAVIGRDDDDRQWLVADVRDDASPGYYLYDRATQTSRLLFLARPALNDYDLAPMEPFSFTAGDGLTVHGYLTFPAGPRETLPAVLYVHGGPWARDVWGFHPIAQWLANRGYVCVQVNYRGSTGYGKSFLHAGDKEWGGKMHQDLIDAVDHLVAMGWVDRHRVGIYGGSYGGYAALCGVTFTPDVFRCAVDLVGPSNLQTLIESVPPYWVDIARQFRLCAADPDTEPELVRERSPLFHVERIRVPLLIGQGANDPRVTRIESEQIVAELQSRGIPHEYMLFEDEGHGFAKPENQQRFQRAVEAFLGEHLGGRVES